jgi:hypothetical protein
MHNFEQTYGQFPPGLGATGDKMLPGMLNYASQTMPPNLRFCSWHIHLMPFIDQQAIFDAINPFVGAGNQTYNYLRNNQAAIYGCPSDPLSGLHLGTYWPSTTYFGVWGIDTPNKMGTANVGDPTAEGILYWRTNTKTGDVTDGLSNTLLVDEHGVVPDAGAPFGSWYATVNEDMDFNISSFWVVWGVRPTISLLGTSNHLSGEFPGPEPAEYRNPYIPLNSCDYDIFLKLSYERYIFLMADGSVRFIPYSANSIMPALPTRIAGDSVGELP